MKNQVQKIIQISTELTIMENKKKYFSSYNTYFQERWLVIVRESLVVPLQPSHLGL